MDFDKLKKAAKETFRIMTGKDDEELFDEISQVYNIYAQRSSLKNIMFTLRDVKRQGTTDYYFCHLQVKFPRNS